MKSHEQLDRRGLALARAVADRIDADPDRRGVERAMACCDRWIRRESHAAYLEWRELLRLPWPEIRQILLDDSEEGRRLRQSSPFCGILTPRERWRILKEFQGHEAA